MCRTIIRLTAFLFMSNKHYIKGRSNDSEREGAIFHQMEDSLNWLSQAKAETATLLSLLCACHEQKYRSCHLLSCRASISGKLASGADVGLKSLDSNMQCTCPKQQPNHYAQCWAFEEILLTLSIRIYWIKDGSNHIEMVIKILPFMIGNPWTFYYYIIRSSTQV